MGAHSLRGVLTALAITLGVAMALAASIIGEAANRQATAVSETTLTVDLEISRRDGARFNTAVLETLRQEEAAAQLVPSLTLTAALQPGDVPVRLLGVPPSAYVAAYRPDLASGRFLPAEDSIVLPMAVALQRGLYDGDAVTLSSDGGRFPFTVGGRLAAETGPLAATEPAAFLPLAAAQQLAGAPEAVDRLAVVLADRVDLETAVTAFQGQLGDDYIVARTAVPGGADFNLIIIQAAVGVIGLIILFAAAFVILNAFAMAVTARTEEIGTLRALGMTRRGVLRLLLLTLGGTAVFALGVQPHIFLATGVFGLVVVLLLACIVLLLPGLVTKVSAAVRPLLARWWGTRRKNWASLSATG